MSWIGGACDVDDDGFIVNPPLLYPIPEDARELTEEKVENLDEPRLPRRDTSVYRWPSFD